MNFQVILLPNLASEENMSIDWWYMDIGLTTPLTSTKIIDETKLYGKYYTVIIATLDVNGGNELVENGHWL